MRHSVQAIMVVMTILFSAFLIERSCHEDKGVYAPDSTGGISQAIAPKIETQNASASPPPGSGDRYPPEGKTAEEVSSAKPSTESTPTVAASKGPREESAGVTSTGTPRPEPADPEVGNPSTGSAGTASTTTAANTRAVANEKLQGTWVLSDGNTRFELTVVNESGVLKARILDAGKSVPIDERVRVTGENNTIYVYSTRSWLPYSGITENRRADELIVLAFHFNADGSPEVVWQRGHTNRPKRLNVVSHVR